MNGLLEVRLTEDQLARLADLVAERMARPATVEADEVVNLRAAARLVRLGTAEVVAAIRRGDLPAGREGRAWIIAKRELTKWRLRSATSSTN